MSYRIKNTHILIQLGFLLLLMVICYKSGKKSESRNILIDKRLQTQFINFEYQKRYLQKRARKMESLRSKLQQYIITIYVVSIVAILGLVGCYFIDIQVIEFTNIYNLIYIIGIVFFVTLLQIGKKWLAFRQSRFVQQLKQSNVEENNVETRILDLLGNQLTSRIKEKLLSEEKQALKQDIQNKDCSLQNVQKQFVKYQEETKLQAKRFRFQIEQLQQENESVNDKLEASKQLMRQKKGRSSLNMDGQEEQCQSLSCQFDKQILSKKALNCEQFINKLVRFEWCQICQGSFQDEESEQQQDKEIREAKKSDDNQLEGVDKQNRERICNQQCMQKYFKLCGKLGQNYTNNIEKINIMKNKKQDQINSQNNSANTSMVEQ